MASTSDIRKGICIKYNSDIYKIVEFLHVKPGKGPAFVRTKLKSITNGKVIDKNFSAGHKIDDVRVETQNYQYMYSESESIHLMNLDDYSQIELPIMVIDNPKLLKEGENVTVLVNAETSEALTVEMPSHVVLEVVETELGLKGNTATNATKQAKLETGASINVPLFIKEGEKIKVDTEKCLYVERAR